jgi:hypothetical protein
MTKDYSAATYGKKCEWYCPAELPCCADSLRANNDLETGFREESGLIHESRESVEPCLNRQTAKLFVTSYRTHVPTRMVATISRGQGHANRESKKDASPTSVISDLHHFASKVSGTTDTTFPSTSRSFPFDALPRTHCDEISLNTIWDGDHRVDNRSFHDDEVLTRLEEGLSFC